jgi:hypothetical protein
VGNRFSIRDDLGVNHSRADVLLLHPKDKLFVPERIVGLRKSLCFLFRCRRGTLQRHHGRWVHVTRGEVRGLDDSDNDSARGGARTSEKRRSTQFLNGTTTYSTCDPQGRCSHPCGGTDHRALRACSWSETRDIWTTWSCCCPSSTRPSNSAAYGESLAGPLAGPRAGERRLHASWLPLPRPGLLPQPAFPPS